jgi:NADPH:quinone reductase-like Zn-dependent oxidoreductase
MTGALLTGHGGFEKLEIRDDVPVPVPGPGEVLIKVAAAGINNTDINTRIGWYSKGVTSATSDGGAEGYETTNDNDASWSGVALTFPRIQGADCCGRIVAVGEGVSPDRIGERVLVRNMLRSYVGYRPWECWTFGSECDGAFAQYAKAPARETYKVDCDWSDVELASVPCAYSTAEGMAPSRAGRQGRACADHRRLGRGRLGSDPVGPTQGRAGQCRRGQGQGNAVAGAWCGPCNSARRQAGGSYRAAIGRCRS